MTNYSFDDTIPATNNNPSIDQPGMLINNASTKSILGVDHVTFGIDNGGSHLQNTFYTQQSPSIGSSLAILYPGAKPSGYVNSTGSSATNTYLLNAGGTFPTSMIKAGGTFFTTTSSGAISFETSFNCLSISSNGSGVYTITLAAVTTGDKIIYLSSISSGFDPNWSYTNPTLTISSVNTIGPKISFIVLQV